MLKRTLLFLFALVVADRLIGAGLGLLYRRCRTGEMGGLTNYALSTDADALVLGSSRAQHHVVPSILSERLGMTVFNAGLDGQDLLYSLILLDIRAASRPAPKLVLLHVDPWSFERSDSELQRASILSPFVDRSAVAREILRSRGPYERLKLLSSSYRYNGKVLAILKNAFARPDPKFDGYEALGGVLRDVPAAPPEDETRGGNPFWDEKVALLDSAAAYCRRHGTRLVLFRSPRFRRDAAVEARWTARMRELLQREPGVAFIDGAALFSADFSGKRELFHDESHLNARGAELFTRKLADELIRLSAPARSMPPTVGAPSAPALPASLR